MTFADLWCIPDPSRAGPQAAAGRSPACQATAFWMHGSVAAVATALCSSIGPARVPLSTEPWRRRCSGPSSKNPLGTRNHMFQPRTSLTLLKHNRDGGLCGTWGSSSRPCWILIKPGPASGRDGCKPRSHRDLALWQATATDQVMKTSVPLPTQHEGRRHILASLSIARNTQVGSKSRVGKFGRWNCELPLVERPDFEIVLHLIS